MKKVFLSLGSILLMGTLLGNTAEAAKVKIGMTVDDLRLERWQRDRDIFTAEANKLGADVVAVSANGDSDKQMRDAENLISQGIDILVVIPNNGDVMGAIVDQAHQDGIKVLAYDRLLTNSDVDAYISFDNEKVGELQGKAIVEAMPKGRYFMMGGSPTDNNAKMFRAGQMKAVQPLVDKGDIVIVGDQWVKDWLPEEAMKIMENALTANDNKIDAVVASNDSTAGGAIQALAAQNLSGKVPISGQDADLAAVKRVVDGTQTVTVYKPIPKLAKEAAALAVKMANNEKLNMNMTVNNGYKEVPSLLLEPIAVTKNNVKETIVKDGFHSEKDVFGK
ncbi:D-xylose ABC transporter substrate-binding protein [Cetobacterium sp. 8H]|uniref:D-xylose ABC transporter substrate-binding protein n=1 Tax=Cetobacterium sp. 8H TaxID=2759681 RepID=UPI00163C3142|nr:D-xylose ABC transporter substrate-binding protein [Cetobacterium sp. 8H]MBC2850924.1 D-xylose ABC transporter substrate-binding protein [Cetobacterium sp. 8H]